MKLPMTPGESTTIRSDYSEGIYSRVRIERHDTGWTLHTETVEGVDENGEPIDYGQPRGDDEPPIAVESEVLAEMFFRSTLDIALAVRGHADMSMGALLWTMSKGSTAMPKRGKSVKFARVTGRNGWYATLESSHGRSDGRMDVLLKCSRPLTAEELIVLCRCYARWSDANPEME
jgi:hypothetical protein